MVGLSDDDKCKSEHAAVEVAEECFFNIHTTNVYLVGDQRPQQHQSFKDVEGTERLEE